MKTKGAVRIKQRSKPSTRLDWVAWLKPVSAVITLACIVVSVGLLIMQLINKDIYKLQVNAPFEHVSEDLIRQELVGVFPDCGRAPYKAAHGGPGGGGKGMA